MNKDVVSIIVPIYNAEKYIKDTIESIIKQSYKNLEIILVDDGSSDNSYSICQNFLYDKRITLLSQKNAGAPAARNNGMNIAQGEYLIFFDSDDILLDDAIEKMVKKIKMENSDLVIGNYSIFQDELVIKKNIQKLNRIKKNIYNLYFTSPFPNNKLYKTAIIKENKIYFDDVLIGQDANFFYKIIPLIKKVSIIDDSVCLYRLTKNSISRKYNARILDINNSLDLVKEDYLNKNREHIYLYYLQIAHLNNINTQIKKLTNFSSQEEAKQCFCVLTLEYKKIFKSLNKKLDYRIFKSIIFYIYYCFQYKKWAKK